MSRGVRWLVAVPATALMSMVLYWLVGAGLGQLAVRLMDKSAYVDINLGIALRMYFYDVYPVLCIATAAANVGPSTRTWRWRGALVAGVPCALAIAYWVSLFSYTPNWSSLVLTSTAAGLALPNYVAARVMRAARERSSRSTAPATQNAAANQSEPG